nr:hypothetical protein HmN_000893900 [Hymenolepis microstoma]
MPLRFLPNGYGELTPTADDSVSINRLKPAYLESPPTRTLAVKAILLRPPTQTTEVTVLPPSLHRYNPSSKMLQPLQFQNPYLSITNPITLPPSNARRESIVGRVRARGREGSDLELYVRIECGERLANQELPFVLIIPPCII